MNCKKCSEPSEKESEQETAELDVKELPVKVGSKPLKYIMPVIICIALLVVIMVIYQMRIYQNSSSCMCGKNGHKNLFAKSGAIILGKYLGQKYSGQKALIICDQGFKMNRRTQQVIDAFKQGLGEEVVADTVQLTASKDMQGPDGELVMPLEEVMTVEDFENTINKHPDCSIIVSMIGLPKDIKNIKFWNNKNKHLAMLIANIFEKKSLIKEGKIVASVSFKPGIRFTEDPAPSEPQKAFDERYILITTENFDQMEIKYPQLFK